MHTCALILFNRPVNKVKTCPGSAPFEALPRGPVVRGSSSVITPVGHQRSAELKEPRMDARFGAFPHRRPHVHTARRPRSPLPRPAAPLQAAAD
ncbi:hypothetical protein D4764_12G0001110 [Takifugu flavidus]|uniref:Uncharacterized protein n=1 Tax=Takifugu flavidus TaxID=433684 RepID=A0A5C6PDA7_9TELE|nr:hypothetical protein D4764_12G0001110 [Takifugu flavidus]